MDQYNFTKVFGKYFTCEPFINHSFRQNVAHVAILITNHKYQNATGMDKKKSKNVDTAPHCRKRMLQFFKGGPFDNGTIERRLQLIEEHEMKKVSDKIA